jgi:anti-sigma regulatory factor (Ser/Thr protein kinase)
MIEWRRDICSGTEAQALRREFMDLLHARGRGDFEAAELVYGELVGNAVRHARGPIGIRLEWDDEHPVLIVHDRNQRFRPPCDLPDDPMAESGRGLFLVKTLALDFRIEDLDHGSRVVARLPIQRVRPPA